jgi:hypothetical protein
MTDTLMTQETSAAATYARRSRRCGMMIDWLAGELDAHAERAAAAPDDWSFAGDLGETERLLGEALAGLIGTTTADVAATVDEAVPGTAG